MDDFDMNGIPIVPGGDRKVSSDDEAIEAAFRWHPGWRDAHGQGLLADEDERHLLVHAAVEGILSCDPQLSALAQAAEGRGADPHEVRHCLGRAFLAGLWDHVHEGTGYDADDMAQRFGEELRQHAGERP